MKWRKRKKEIIKKHGKFQPRAIINIKKEMKMYKRNKITETSINVNTSYIGETIEQKIERITNNKEPITDGAPLIYTERVEGVKPEFDIRTDRFEIAIDAMDKVSKAEIAKREQRIATKNDDKKDGEAKPIDTPEPKL